MFLWANLGKFSFCQVARLDLWNTSNLTCQVRGMLCMSKLKGGCVEEKILDCSECNFTVTKSVLLWSMKAYLLIIYGYLISNPLTKKPCVSFFDKSIVLVFELWIIRSEITTLQLLYNVRKIFGLVKKVMFSQCQSSTGERRANSQISILEVS